MQYCDTNNCYACSACATYDDPGTCPGSCPWSTAGLTRQSFSICEGDCDTVTAAGLPARQFGHPSQGVILAVPGTSPKERSRAAIFTGANGALTSADFWLEDDPAYNSKKHPTSGKKLIRCSSGLGRGATPSS